ncbi:hypothetical protein LIER_33970 [Lithospermum erythrorhizon]|uniref:FAD-linked oxidase C-terminal domain-containing protein n=1 Tax=Lithospermum erythrorhizon TaxID=34254 RepID=A0AAV3RZN7_LITER
MSHGMVVSLIYYSYCQYLEEEFGMEALRTMKKIKDALDPNGIMNPGKLIPPHGRLSKKDRLRSWGMEVEPNYLLCGGVESHDHLFFASDFSTQIWRMVLQKLNEYRGARSWS